MSGSDRELDSVGGSGEPAYIRRSPNKIEPLAWSEWKASDGELQMVGDRMVRSQGDVNQGITIGGQQEPIGIRAFVVAKRRVTIVERRDAGR
jgi:hypothetical protein